MATFSADIYIPSCFRKDCKEKMKKMCDDLERNQLSCAYEQRLDFKLSGLYFDKFKTMTEHTNMTIIHLCPQILQKMKMVSDICEQYADRIVFLYTEATPEALPEYIQRFVIEDLSDDTYYTRFIDHVVDTIKPKNPPQMNLKDMKVISESFMTLDLDPNDETDADALETFDELFENVPDISEDRERCPQVRSVLLKYKPNPRLSWALPEECMKLASSFGSFDRHHLADTVKCVIGEALPQLYKDGNINALAMMLECPEKRIRAQALGMIEILLLKSITHLSRKDLEQLENIVYSCLSKRLNKAPEETSTEDHAYVHLVRVYLMVLSGYVLVVHRQGEQEIFHKHIQVIMSRKHSPLPKKSGKNKGVTDDLLKVLDEFLSAVVGRASDLASTVSDTMSNTDLKKAAATVSKRSWPCRFITMVAVLNKLFQSSEANTLDLIHAIAKSFRSKRRLTEMRKPPNAHLMLFHLTLGGMVIFLQHRLREISGTDVYGLQNKASHVINTTMLIGMSEIPSLTEHIKSLMFHKNFVVRGSVIDLFKHAGLYPNCLLRTIQEEIQRLLTPCLVNVCEGKILDTENQDRWNTCSGAIAGERILVHIYLPTESEHRTSNQSNKEAPEDVYLNEVEILRHLLDHENILQMYAFSLAKGPQFYITEDYLHNNLQSVLKNKSNDRDWFTSASLLKFLMNILDAVAHLHKYGVVHRDITAASVFWIREKEIVKLCRFNLARMCDRDKLIVERNCASIPTRWSAPESLREFRFSSRSDIWMAGHLMYEVLTHGCLPYSDLDKSDKEIVSLILKGRKNLFHEKSIRTSLFETIMQCTQYDENQRPTATEVRRALEDEYEIYWRKEDTSRHLTLNVVGSTFPDLKKDRKPSTDLLRGIHKIEEEDGICRDRDEANMYENQKKNSDLPTYRTIRPQFKSNEYESPSSESTSSGKSAPEPIYEDPDNLYTNTRPKAATSKDFSVYTETEDLDWIKQKNNLLFKERNFPAFPTKEWTSLTTEQVPGIPYKLRIVQEGGRDTLQYQLPENALGCMRGVCRGRGLGDNPIEYMKCLCVTAQRLCELHARDWVHGNIAAETVWVIQDEVGRLEVCFVGISKMRLLPRDGEDGLEQERILKPPTDRIRQRRCAPEVLKSETYSKASDVFSFGLMMWDVINLSYQLKKNSGTLPKSDPPLVDIPNSKLYYEHVTTAPNNELLPKPQDCPDELYNLILTCWYSERHKRPPMSILTSKLEHFISSRSEMKAVEYDIIDFNKEESDSETGIHTPPWTAPPVPTGPSDMVGRDDQRTFEFSYPPHANLRRCRTPPAASEEDPSGSVFNAKVMVRSQTPPPLWLANPSEPSTTGTLEHRRGSVNGRRYSTALSELTVANPSEPSDFTSDRSYLDPVSRKPPLTKQTTVRQEEKSTTDTTQGAPTLPGRSAVSMLHLDSPATKQDKAIHLERYLKDIAQPCTYNKATKTKKDNVIDVTYLPIFPPEPQDKLPPALPSRPPPTRPHASQTDEDTKIKNAFMAETNSSESAVSAAVDTKGSYHHRGASSSKIEQMASLFETKANPLSEVPRPARSPEEREKAGEDLTNR